MTASLYVYYKAASGPELTDRVLAMQADLALRCGFHGRLMRRRDAPDTWMEVYEPIASFETFEPLLAEAVARHSLETLLLAGERRHLERFVAV